MKDGVRTAVVGVGNVSREYHLPIIDRHRGSELVALCDQDEAALRDCAAEYDVTGYTGLGTMLDEERIDSVHVCTPPQSHAAIAEEVMSNDVPVLIEKPATTSVAELERLDELATEYDVPSCVVHNQLFFPCTREAVSRVDAGEIGDVSSVTMLFSEPRDLTETPRGDWVFDLPGAEIGEGIVHQVYLPLAFVTGLGEVRSINKGNYSGYDDSVGFDGLVIEAVDATGDRTITIKILTTSEHKNELLIHGTEGELTLDLLKRAVFRERIGTSDDVTYADMMISSSLAMLQQLALNLVEQGFGEISRQVYDRFGHERALSHHGHYWLIREYVEAVRTGGEPPVPLADALATIEVLEAIGAAE